MQNKRADMETLWPLIIVLVLLALGFIIMVAVYKGVFSSLLS